LRRQKCRFVRFATVRAQAVELVVTVPDLLLDVLQDAQKLRRHGTRMPEYARKERMAL
jgi:hypothetical protein